MHFGYLKLFTALGCQMEQSPKVKNNDSDKITDTGGVELSYPIEKNLYSHYVETVEKKALIL